MEFPDERQLVVRARSQLEQWTNSARTAAYDELFEGDAPILTAEGLQFLDTLESALWRYSERVATLIEEELDEFIRQTRS